MKRILSLDGGGIRGLFTLQILKRLETILRERTKNPDYLLCDHYDMIAGTSTGAIIATYLAWGKSAAEVEQLYLKNAKKMFARNQMSILGVPIVGQRITAGPLKKILREEFEEDDGSLATLGSSKLKTMVVLVTFRSDSLSPWPLTNNTNAIYNDRKLPDCNLDIPLWQVVRASAAAPYFFPPQRVHLGDNYYYFCDGGISGFNNPSHLSYRIATLPAYKVEWPIGAEELSILSVGTGDFDSGMKRKNRGGAIDLLAD